jgi:hypothetical protein
MTIQSRQCPLCDRPLPSVSAGRVCDAPHCRVTYRRHLEAGGRTCLVCGCPLPSSAARAATPDGCVAANPGRAATCGRMACDVQYLRQRDLPAERRCRICRVPLPPHRVAIGVCDDRECAAIHAGHRLAEATRREKERLQRLREAGESRKLREAASAGVEDPYEFTVVVVPHIDLPLRPRDEERVGRVRARLESLVRWAFTHEPHESELLHRPGWSSTGEPDSSAYQPQDIGAEASAVESPLFGAGCRLCRGSCCRTGAEHAYLNIKQIREFIGDHPELSAEEEVIDAYLSHVPELSIENSCIFHGERGCTLPREMRSDMCNRWLCPGLKKIRDTLEEGSPPLFYLVSADEDTASEEIAAAEFVTAADDPAEFLS